MKRINLIKDVVFGIAIIFLLIYVFAQKGAIKSQEEKDHTSDSIQQEKKNEVAFADLNIAYVNIDSVIQKYDYYHVLNQKFVKKRQRLESEYQAKQQKLQERSNDLNYKMQKHLILQSEAEKIYTELMEESAELKKYGQQLTQQLAE